MLCHAIPERDDGISMNPACQQAGFDSMLRALARANVGMGVQMAKARRFVDPLDALLDAAGIVHVLDDREAGAFQQRWRETYCRQLHADEGSWSVGGFDWHVFSGGFARRIADGAALEAFRAEPDGEVVVVSSWTKESPEGWVLARKPQLEELRRDLTVSPRSLAWTMAFTHEHGWLGPYFSRAEWQQEPDVPRRPRRRR
jgi:hypothetical protein